MNKKQLETSKSVLAYQSSSYGTPQPVVLMATVCYSRHFPYGGGIKLRRQDASCKPRQNRGFNSTTYGYPVMLFHDPEKAQKYYDEMEFGALDKMIDEEGLYVNDLQPEGARLELVNNRHLVGPWDEVKAKVDAERAERARLRQERSAQIQAWDDQAMEAFLDLSDLVDPAALDVTLLRASDGRVSINLDTLTAILKYAKES